MISGVPYDAEVEYISSPLAGPFIDTGIIPTQNTGLDFEFTHISMDTPFGIGADWGTASYANHLFGVIYSSQNRVLFRYGTNVNDLYGDFTFVIGRTYSFSSRRGVASGFDGLNWNFSNADFICSNSLLLGAIVQSPNNILKRGIPQYHYLRVYDNSSLVRDLIPVRVGTVGYMYDRVTRNLFGNKGTGAFTIGPDVAKPVMGVWRFA